MTDRQIIELFLHRDESAIREVEQHYGKRLTQIAEQLLSKEDAEECINDLYLAMWNHIPPDIPLHLLSYMASILKNIARDKLRSDNATKRNATIVELSAELTSCIPDPNSSTQDQAVLLASDVLNKFLKAQPRKRREMFVLRYWYGKSIAEIAKQCGSTCATVEKSLYRMRKSLKQALME